MDDLIKSFKAQLYDRVTSPLLSSFLISWALWNNRLFVVLISTDLKLKEKFSYVDNVLYPTIYEVGLRGILWPLLSALALLLLYPIPGRWIYEYVRKEQKKLKEIQQRIDDDTPLTLADARELRSAIRKAEAESETNLKDRDKLIAELRSEVARLENQIEEAERQRTSMSSSALTAYDERQIKILAVLATEGELPVGLIQVRSQTSAVIVEHELDQMVAQGYIDETKRAGVRTFNITAKGRAFVVEHGEHLLEAGSLSSID